MPRVLLGAFTCSNIRATNIEQLSAIFKKRHDNKYRNTWGQSMKVDIVVDGECLRSLLAQLSDHKLHHIHTLNCNRFESSGALNLISAEMLKRRKRDTKHTRDINAFAEQLLDAPSAAHVTVPRIT